MIPGKSLLPLAKQIRFAIFEKTAFVNEDRAYNVNSRGHILTDVWTYPVDTLCGPYILFGNHVSSDKINEYVIKLVTAMAEREIVIPDDMNYVFWSDDIDFNASTVHVIQKSVLEEDIIPLIGYMYYARRIAVPLIR
jgi:hypothetical protein